MEGIAAQKNSAMDKASGDWVLQLDADEALEPELAEEIAGTLRGDTAMNGYWIPRKNFFLGRWIKHGGFYPDPKLRLVRRGAGRFVEYGAHPTVKVEGSAGQFSHALLHNAYPTMRGYIDHMNSYSSMGAEVAAERGHGHFSVLNIVAHLYHSAYVSWKYAKAWELGRRK